MLILEVILLEAGILLASIVGIVVLARVTRAANSAWADNDVIVGSLAAALTSAVLLGLVGLVLKVSEIFQSSALTGLVAIGGFAGTIAILAVLTGTKRGTDMSNGPLAAAG